MLRTSVVAGLAMVIALAGPARAEEPTGEQLIDALNAVFGQHPKTRASHAKGFCVKGSFTPAPAAAGLSKAPLFERAVPTLGRFSMAGGNPKIADNTKSAPRGFAIRIGPEGNYTNLVMISAPVFFARTPAQMIEFLKVRVKAPGADAPDQTKIKTFSETHPETTRQGAWLANRPVPASYATVNYWAVHAYTLTNAQGETKTVKFKAVPAKGEVGLGEEEAKEKGENFYKSELEGRLAGGPAAFDLLAIIGEPGDEMVDPTVMWEEDARAKVKLGTVMVEALEDDAVCDAMTFDPSTLPDGINGPENDPIFAARSGAYAVSVIRRAVQ
jgi:catalase